jgi:hypothetical protein
MFLGDISFHAAPLAPQEASDESPEAKLHQQGK